MDTIGERLCQRYSEQYRDAGRVFMMERLWQDQLADIILTQGIYTKTNLYKHSGPLSNAKLPAQLKVIKYFVIIRHTV